MARMPRLDDEPALVASVVDADHAPRAAAATASNTMRKIISNLDIDDLAEPEPARDGQDPGDDQAHDPEEVVRQRLQVVELDQVDREGEHGRGQAEHHGREPAFGCEGAQLAADPLALDHRVGDGVEQDGEVSTDLP